MAEGTHNPSESRGSFERLIAALSTRFTGLPAEQVDNEVEQTLRVLVEFLDTDRATLFEFSVDGASIHPTHSWARPGIRPYTTALVRAEVPWYHDQLVRGETIRVEHLPDGVSPEAAADAARVFRAGLKAFLTVPIAVGGRFICALSTAAFKRDLTWSDATVEHVRTIGQIVANALYRRRAEAALQAQLLEISEIKQRLEAENVYLREEIGLEGDGEIVGRSPVLREVLAQIDKVAPTTTAVLLLGETGTGKDLLARAIHHRSRRRDRALVKVDCAALPATLIESELFGHEKGAFTGATTTRLGRFELADGGTLFLDEIGELPVDLQAKLLRVLQDGEFERVGSSKTHRADVRVVAATNRDLSRAIAERRFREDLYYRLGVFPIQVPPLRERREDIPLLVWAIIELRQAGLGRHIEHVPARAMDALVGYAWPGNVRELENVIERALILSPGPTLRLEEPFGSAALAATAPSPGDRLDEIERRHILGVLERCGWRIDGKGHAAEVLGLQPSTLRSRMEKLGIRRPLPPNP
jgi:formate hydrogenlyase transcriptional activator